MIIDFSVSNFGPIKDRQTLSFEADKSQHLEDYYVHKVGNKRLLNLIFIYGANASGKTTILKALDFLRQFVSKPLVQKDQLIDVTPFLFDATSANENTIFELNFVKNDLRYYYFIEFNKSYIVKEVLKSCFLKPRARLKTIVTRTTDIDSQTVDVDFTISKIDSSIVKLMRLNTLWNTSIFSGYNRLSLNITELRDVVDWFIYDFQGLLPSSSISDFVLDKMSKGLIDKSSLISILQKADLSISDLQIEKREEHIPESVLNMVMNDTSIQYGKRRDLESRKTIINYDVNFVHQVGNESYLLSSKLESNGTMHYYGLAGLLYYMLYNKASFCIDELESSLHPDLFRNFILSYLYNSRSTQCIVTTHNREILGEKDIYRNDAIWMTEKNEMGATELYSLSHFDSSVIRNTTSVLNAYKIGKLGAVPNLGDYFLNIEDNEE